jgi:hypothetical protein
MMIGGRRAAIHLSDWLDANTPDAQAAARAAVRRVALSFLEALGLADGSARASGARPD